MAGDRCMKSEVVLSKLCKTRLFLRAGMLNVMGPAQRPNTTCKGGFTTGFAQGLHELVSHHVLLSSLDTGLSPCGGGVTAETPRSPAGGVHWHNSLQRKRDVSLCPTSGLRATRNSK